MAKKTPQLVSLALLLKDAGWSQRQIATELGVSQNAIWIWLETTEQRDIRLAKVKKMYQTKCEKTPSWWIDYRSANADSARANELRWREANKPIVRAKDNSRRQKIKTYKPSPSERKAINQIYLASKPGDHTDHIYPIAKGGLHHPWNLRNITAEENRRKGANVAPNTGPVVELVPGGFIPLPHFMI